MNLLKTIIPLQCKKGEHFILSVKGKKVKWKEIPFKYINEKKLSKQLKEFEKQYPKSEYDHYFCPVTYRNNRRRKAEAIDTKFLWQDIDEHEDPYSIEPAPTYLWESSPGKYQGLWELDRYIGWEEAEVINKALSERIGSDSCWDVGHVLRIPGSINHKYKNNPEIPEAEKVRKSPYRLKVMKEQVGVGKEKKKKEKKETTKKGKSLDAKKIIKKYKISGDLLDKLTQEEAEAGRRSDVIWYLENKLYDKGLEIPEILTLIKNSCWNKYKGRDDEDLRLKTELEKILKKGLEEGTQLSRLDLDRELKVESYSEVMSNMNSFPGWLVEGFWGRRSHGIVAGQPKVFKSTFVHDLAVSVASGKPFLGKYPVVEPGPVILIQNENADWLMKDRTEKIVAQRDLGGKIKHISDRKIRVEMFPPEIPLYSINQQGFSFSNNSDLEQIEELIKEIKPVLVIFDPLYLMFGGSLNSAEELNPILNWLLSLKNDYKTGVLLVHHYNKGTDDNRGGQKMLGSVALHGWVESAWYLRRNPDQPKHSEDPNQAIKDPASIIMEREFRTAASYPELELKIKMGPFGDSYYDVDVDIYDPDKAKESCDEAKEVAKDTIVSILSHTTTCLSLSQLWEDFESQNYSKINKKEYRALLDELIKEGSVVKNKKGYLIK